MFIEKFKNRGKYYVRLAQNHKYIKDGKTKYSKRMIKYLGNVDNLPVPFETLRENFNNGIALIPELEEFIADDAKIKFEMDSNKTYIEKNVGYIILNHIFNQLGISHVLTLEKSRQNLKYDVLGLAKLLVLERIISPSSKIKTFDNKDMFLEEVTRSNDFREIYDVLDVLNKKSEQIVNVMNSAVEKTIGRDKGIVFYDVTNYYFEIDTPDADGLRKAGVSKENRKSPIVQMGMFLDRNSIPISYHLHQGNTLDSLTLRPSMEKYIDKYDLDNILIVADRGMNSGGNELHILENGNDYLFARSVRKSKKEIKGWILEEKDYIHNENNTFKYKSKIIERVAVSGKTKKVIQEKVLVYWSRSFYERELKEKERFLETLEKYREDPNSIPKRKSKGLEKYIITEQQDKKTGEIVRTKEIRSINISKVEQENELMGYYILTTSKKEMDEMDMIRTYKGLTKIENCFRISKSELETRPVYVRKEEHINGHFLICFIALTMMRLLQYRISQKEDKGYRVWREGMSARRIQESLREFKVAVLEGRCIFKEPDKDLKELLEKLEIDFDFKICREHEVSRKLRYSSL